MIIRRLGRYLLFLMLAGVAVVFILATVLYIKIEPQLPPIDVLRDVQLQEPLRIYSRDRKLLAEYGEKRRTPIRIEDAPPALVNAFLAAEDDRFFKHQGVDYAGLMRAGIALIRTGEKRQGGSTITMQVARNFFLSKEKTYLRKLTEILLALKIERSLSKNEILELYLNKIYLGHRAYGVAAAAQVYYGTGINDLSVARAAMIAALPKAPSRVNPVNNPAAAIARRNYVLHRMRKLGHIDEATFTTAVAEPDDAELHTVKAEARAPYLAEMVRSEMVKQYGPAAYTSGYDVITTLNTVNQTAANHALQQGLLAYSRRHGYYGPEARVDLAGRAEATWPALLSGYRVTGGLAAGLVTAVGEQSCQVLLGADEVVTIEWDGLAWARPYKDVNRMGKAPAQAGEVVAIGDIVRLAQLDDGNWRLEQVPRIEGALVSIDPDDGAILALVGGFDFQRSKFNRVTQAMRQPGSAFKPVIYSAALEKGFTPASIINDAPVVFDDPALESTWRPENYSGRFHGPTRLREALYRSRNLVSIRILRSIGAAYAARYAEHFGFSAEQLPRDLTLALGSPSVTPLQMARAYAVLANGGYLVDPYFIQSIHDATGEVVFQADPLVVCPYCRASAADGKPEPATLPRQAPQVLSPQNAWLMTSMMQDVIKRGTGSKARVLGRTDLAGKTGTTNDQMDAWFSGFNHSLVATTWVGFDKLEPLGRGETGGRAALPVWIDYMRQALADTAASTLEQPEGLVTVRIDPATGLLADSGRSDAIFETFRAGTVPEMTSEQFTPGGASGAGGSAVEQLF